MDENGSSRHSSTDLVFVVPGLDVSRPGQAMELLLEGLDCYLRKRCDVVASHQISTRQGEGVSQAFIKATLSNNEVQRLELRELAWTDLRPSMGEVSVYERLVRGAILIYYWMSFWVRKGPPRTSASLQFWTVFGTVALLIWYLLVIAATVHELSDLMTSSGKDADGWPSKAVWFGIIAALGVKQMTKGVDLSWTTYAFMSNRDSLRHKLRMRLLGMISGVKEEGYQFRRTILLAHSFGTAVAADALGSPEQAQREIPDNIDLITLGSPLEFLAWCDESVQEVVQSCLEFPHLRSWTDYYAEEDAFCSRVPLNEVKGNKFTANRVNLGYSAFKAWTGQAHNAYFSNAEVLRVLVGLPAA
jgi:hypothetical protein